MRTITVSISGRATGAQVSGRVQRAIEQAGLAVRTRGTLKTYAGSIHWHIVKPGEKGKLELTYWPAQQSLWFKIAAGRSAEWINELLPGLCASLAGL